MDLELNSTEIIEGCSQEHGKGRRFYRTDGLQFEERRAADRLTYIESHPATNDEHREAILSAAAIPGMTTEELTAAWGLLEEDTRMVFGHVTEISRGTFGYFTGFRIGEPYAVYLHDEVVVGIALAEELVPPHKYELTMRIVEEKRRLRYFYEGRGDFLVGSDIDQQRAGYDVLHNFLYVIEPVMPLSISQIEGHLGGKRLKQQYDLALSALGYEACRATAELRTYVALSLLPFPQPENFNIWETPDEGLLKRGPLPVPPHLLLPEDPALSPPEAWFAKVARGVSPEAAFPDQGGGIEMVRVERIKERIFRVTNLPLFVNDVAPYDLVELEWRADNIVPQFKRRVESGGCRVIRAMLDDRADSESIARFVKEYVSDTQMCRQEKGMLVFTIVTPELKEIARDMLGYMTCSWIYTDTLNQQPSNVALT